MSGPLHRLLRVSSEAETKARIEAALELSGTLSYVGAKLLSEAGALRELYVRDLPPEDYRIAELRKWVNDALEALNEYDEAVRAPAPTTQTVGA